jgi:hypothetical protein
MNISFCNNGDAKLAYSNNRNKEKIGFLMWHAGELAWNTNHESCSKFTLFLWFLLQDILKIAKPDPNQSVLARSLVLSNFTRSCVSTCEKLFEILIFMIITFVLVKNYDIFVIIVVSGKSTIGTTITPKI